MGSRSNLRAEKSSARFFLVRAENQVCRNLRRVIFVQQAKLAKARGHLTLQEESQ